MPPFEVIEFLDEEEFFENTVLKIEDFLTNMYGQVVFQSENEQLPTFQKRIDTREYVALRVRDLNPRYSRWTINWVRNRRVELNLDEVANREHE